MRSEPEPGSAEARQTEKRGRQEVRQTEKCGRQRSAADREARQTGLWKVWFKIYLRCQEKILDTFSYLLYDNAGDKCE